MKSPPTERRCPEDRVKFEEVPRVQAPVEVACSVTVAAPAPEILTTPKLDAPASIEKASVLLKFTVPPELVKVPSLSQLPEMVRVALLLPTKVPLLATYTSPPTAVVGSFVLSVKVVGATPPTRRLLRTGKPVAGAVKVGVPPLASTNKL